MNGSPNMETVETRSILEAFEPLFGKENIYIMDDTVGHGAPWNLGLYEYMDENVGGEILWTPAEALPFKTPRIQTMLFIHFSQFTPRFSEQHLVLR